jgi:hypothetical protein
LILFPRLRAVALQCELPSGATRPCVFSCEDEEGQPCGEYVVKLRADVRGGATGLLFEFLAAQLAAHFGIAMPTPAHVELSDDVAAAIPDQSIARRIAKSAGLNFGTRFMSGGYVTWPVDDPVPVVLRQTAVEILAFDAVIDNADRRREKPNLLWKGDELLVIDHEMAFAFTRLIGQPHRPFEGNATDFLREHPLRAGLRRTEVDLDRFTGELEALSGGAIEGLCHAAPPEFGTEHMDRIVGWLKQATESADQLVAAIRRLL